MTDKLPATLEAVITARIAPIIGEMIPEPVLRETVKRVTDQFLQTELPSLIRAELSERCKEMIKAELSSAEYSTFWNNGKENCSDRMKQLIRDLAPDLVVAAMSAPFAQLLNNMRNNLQQIGRGY